MLFFSFDNNVTSTQDLCSGPGGLHTKVGLLFAVTTFQEAGGLKVHTSSYLDTES